MEAAGISREPAQAGQNPYKDAAAALRQGWQHGIEQLRAHDTAIGEPRIDSLLEGVEHPFCCVH